MRPDGKSATMDFPGFRGEIGLNEPLSRHTSYAIGGPADVLAWPADRDDLALLLRECSRQGAAVLVLGGGTNLLVKDGGFRGVVICLDRMRSIRTVREYRSVDGEYAVLDAEAGSTLASLVGFAAERGYAGIEFAAGIPGTVGGAVRMNAGTAEGEMCDVIETVTMITPAGEVATVDGGEMEFGYRTARLPERNLIVSATLVLRRGDPARIRERVRGLLARRRERQPWGEPNAGSVFKNPLNEAAGRLIEAAGLKGRRVGDAVVSEKHANFIVNRGAATAADVLRLMEIVRQAVFEAHGVMLEPEIMIVGED